MAWTDTLNSLVNTAATGYAAYKRSDELEEELSGLKAAAKPATNTTTAASTGTDTTKLLKIGGLVLVAVLGIGLIIKFAFRR
ncbi:hypothetical protein OpiT1DRAFT_04746 [Opitutaceae bacterium TAV1]|nr:hypothetical protein OpiT1DRAFT_04746 [Opitutaceae bacterium TAV1]